MLRVSVRAFAPTLVGVVVVLVYISTMPRGLSWDLGGADGGELATGVYTLGLVHSPGYPTYLLLAQAARLLPLESLALRLNVFSVICAALACSILAAMASNTVQDRGTSPVGAVLIGTIPGLLFGLSELVWTQAIIIEVYTLAALFCTVLVTMTFWIEHAPDEAHFLQRLTLWMVVAGAGLGSHYMVALVIGFGGIYLLLRATSRLLRLKNCLALTGIVLGLGVFAYLPLRAGAVAASNWGNPDTLERLIWVVRGDAYTDRLQPATALTLLPSLVRVIVQQVSVPGLVLGVMGFSVWWDTNRPLLVAALATIMVNLLLVTSYNSADTLPYVYPTLILFALACGTASYTLLYYWLPQRSRRYHLAFLSLATIVVCVPLLIRGGRIVSSATTQADEYGRRTVQDVPTNSLIISSTDHHTFALRYAAIVSLKRTDIIPIDARMLQYTWFREDMVRFYPQLGLEADSTDFQLTELLERVPADMPILFTYLPNSDIIPRGSEMVLSDNGLTYELIRPSGYQVP